MQPKYNLLWESLLQPSENYQDIGCYDSQNRDRTILSKPSKWLLVGVFYTQKIKAIIFSRDDLSIITFLNIMSIIFELQWDFATSQNACFNKINEMYRLNVRAFFTFILSISPDKNTCHGWWIHIDRFHVYVLRDFWTYVYQYNRDVKYYLN